mgnify:CR=1 FL=1
MKVKNVEIELTEDWHTFKKGDVLNRSRDIANIHISELKNAKIYVKKVIKKKSKK